jgi:hypothetical protein
MCTHSSSTTFGPDEIGLQHTQLDLTNSGFGIGIRTKVNQHYVQLTEEGSLIQGRPRRNDQSFTGTAYDSCLRNIRSVKD